jgi:hypothetical protein
MMPKFGFMGYVRFLLRRPNELRMVNIEPRTRAVVLAG